MVELPLLYNSNQSPSGNEVEVALLFAKTSFNSISDVPFIASGNHPTLSENGVGKRVVIQTPLALATLLVPDRTVPQDIVSTRLPFGICKVRVS